MARPFRRFALFAGTGVVVAAALALGLLTLTGGGASAGGRPEAADHPSSVGAGPRVVETTPAAGGTLPLGGTVLVAFDRSLPADAPTPSFNPAVTGTWTRRSPTELSFTATDGFPPGTSETLIVPGPAGRAPLTVPFTVAPMSVLRVEQLLASLGYLPVTFVAANPAAPAPATMAMDQAGTFSWRWTTMPPSFVALWQPGQENVLVTGAVMSFESQHGLVTDGVAGPKVWQALLQAAAADEQDPYGHYDWVQVSTTVPESATVWRDGAVLYRTVANTGIEGERTTVGTWPVYARYTSTTMSGTNPDGSHYDDPGVPWVSYFHGGDALHGFVRASYGTPQSLGCVEMPPANAAVVYPLTPIGTLVTVEPSQQGASMSAPTTTAQPDTSTTVSPTTTAPPVVTNS